MILSEEENQILANNGNLKYIEMLAKSGGQAASEERETVRNSDLR